MGTSLLDRRQNFFTPGLKPFARDKDGALESAGGRVATLAALSVEGKWSL